MSVNDKDNDNANNANSTKTNFSKMKSPIYFSPYAHKMKAIGNLYTEPRKIPIQTDFTAKIKAKQKISNQSLTNNMNLDPQESFRKSTKVLSQINENNNTDKSNPIQSFKNINSKLYLKKNIIPNLSAFNETRRHALTAVSTTNLNTQVNSRNKILNKENKPGISKMNGGKNNSNNNNYTNTKDSSLLKKSASSATELFINTTIKKAKTKSKNDSDLNNIDINPINPLGNILSTTSTTGNSNRQFLSHQPGQGQKIIILKKEKTTNLKDKHMGNINKDSFKIIQTQTNKQIKTNNLENKDKDKENIQYLLRNTYNNVKIYPTTFLNNKIIYQSENNNNISNITSDNSRIHIYKNKSEKIMFDKDNNNKGNLFINLNNQNPNSVEEVHFLYVKTVQNGKNLILKMDKCNI